MPEHQLQLHQLHRHVAVVGRRQRLQRLRRRAIQQLKIGGRRQRAQAQRQARHELQQAVPHILLRTSVWQCTRRGASASWLLFELSSKCAAERAALGGEGKAKLDLRRRQVQVPAASVRAWAGLCTYLQHRSPHLQQVLGDLDGWNHG